MTGRDPLAQLEVLTQFVHSAPIGMIQFAADGSVAQINPAAAQMVEPMAQCDRSNAYRLLAPIAPDLAAAVAAFVPAAGMVVRRQRADIATPDGSLLAVSLNVQRVGPATYMAVVRDITHLVVQDRLLSRDAQRFRAIIDGVQDYAIYVLDHDGRVTDWNRSISRIAGWQPGDVEGRYIGDFFVNDATGPGGVHGLLATARREGAAEAEGWRLRRDGSRFWASTAFIALRDDGGHVWGFVGISRDLTERKRMEDELRVLAVTDPLTGAFNRRYGQACLADELRRRDRHGTPLSVLMVDIDRFKAINDRFGHDAGDVALRALVAACTRTLRAIDVFVRWGGEEFLAVMADTPARAAAQAAERICAEVAALRISLGDGTSIGFTVSIGVAEAEDSSMAFLLARADAALYAAKTAGRNRVTVAGVSSLV